MGKLVLPRNQWAKSFPINNLIVSLLQKYSFPDQRPSEKDKQNIKCIPCSLDEKQSVAVSFCLTCSEYLCKECGDIHKKFKETRNHTVLENNQLPNDISVFERINEMCHCNVHSDRNLSYKCNEQSCNKFLCSICATIDHRQHNITRIDKMDNTCMRRCLQIENQDTLMLKSCVQSNMNDILSDAEKLQNDAAKIKSSTCLRIEKLISSITRVQNDVALELCRQIENKVSSHTDSIPNCVGLISKLNRLKEITETVLKHGTEEQVLILIDEIKKEKALLRKKMHLQGAIITDIATHGQNITHKMERLNTIMDILLDISCKLFETLETSEEAEIPFDYERVLTVYKDEVNGQGDITLCKVVFHRTPSSDKVVSESVLVTPVVQKAYKNTCVGTDSVTKKDMCVGTKPLWKKDASIETLSLVQRDKCNGTDHLLTQSVSYSTERNTTKSWRANTTHGQSSREVSDSTLKTTCTNTAINTITSASSQNIASDYIPNTTQSVTTANISAPSQIRKANEVVRLRRPITPAPSQFIYSESKLNSADSVRNNLNSAQSQSIDSDSVPNIAKAVRTATISASSQDRDADSMLNTSAPVRTTRTTAPSQVIFTDSMHKTDRSIRNTTTTAPTKSARSDLELNATKSVRTTLKSAPSQSLFSDPILNTTRSVRTADIAAPLQNLGSDTNLNSAFNKSIRTTIISTPSQNTGSESILNVTKSIPFEQSDIRTMMTQARSETTDPIKITSDSIMPVSSQSYASDSVLDRTKSNESSPKSAPTQTVDNDTLVYNTKTIGTTEHDSVPFRRKAISKADDKDPIKHTTEISSDANTIMVQDGSLYNPAAKARHPVDNFEDKSEHIKLFVGTCIILFVCVFLAEVMRMFAV